MTIPHSRPSLGAQELEQLAEAVSSGFVAPGEKGRQLGAGLAERYGCRFGLALNSCTSALHVALMGLGVGRGDLVAVPGLSCPAILHPITYVGADRAIVDVRVTDHQMDLGRLKAIHVRTPVKAAIVPYRYGHAADLSEIHESGIRIIEDFAHSIGATTPPRGPMLQGTVGVFSFYATKMITTGCGGALVTNDEALAAFASSVSDYYSPGISHETVRYNYRLSDLSAAMGLSQLRRLDELMRQRRMLADRYVRLLGHEFRVIAPERTDGSVWYRFVIACSGREQRDAMLERSRRADCGLGTIDVLFDPASATDEHVPVSRAEWDACVSLPIYPDLTRDQQDRIVSCVREWR